MAPWRPGRASPYPVIVGHWIRVKFNYERLDVRLRLRIRLRRHTKGITLAPRAAGDAEATDWIQGQVATYGSYRWTPTGWKKTEGWWAKGSKEKSKKEPG